METLDDFIENATDARVLKRALCVKMWENGLPPSQICTLLKVSEQYVSKWKNIYFREGVSGLHLKYQGSESYLTGEQKQAITLWIQQHLSLTVEEVRDYVEREYGVLYQSKQSYYDLLEAGGMSYHKSELSHPKRDESQIEEKREEIKKKWQKIGRP